MPLAISMVWRNQSSDCYFCLTETTGITSKSKNTEQYPDFPSAMRPSSHRELLPVPNPPGNLTFSNYNFDYNEDHRQQEGDNVDSNPIFKASCPSSETHLSTPGDLNNQDLNFPD